MGARAHNPRIRPYTRVPIHVRLCVCVMRADMRETNARARGRVSTCRQVRPCTMQTHARTYSHRPPSNWMHHHCQGALQDMCIMFPLMNINWAYFFGAHSEHITCLYRADWCIRCAMRTRTCRDDIRDNAHTYFCCVWGWPSVHLISPHFRCKQNQREKMLADFHLCHTHTHTHAY